MAESDSAPDSSPSPTPGSAPESAPGSVSATEQQRRSDHSKWNWLLLIPIVLPLLTPLYNFDTPRLFGFPAFYWLQFSFILVGVATTSWVYQVTRKRSVR
jgi:uncharacterized protein DUF3311